jgi:hemerythrin
MPIIEWKEDYRIGEQQIDLHHQFLFALLNTTYDNFVAFASTDDLEHLFNEFIDYATYHFSAEEELMRKSGFPGFTAHKEEHDAFTRRVVEMYKAYLAGRQSLTLELLLFLNDWLSKHILRSDAEIGRFLQGEKRGASLSTEDKEANV